MPDLIVTLLLIAAIVLLADMLLAGGAMTMMGATAAIGMVAHPIVAGALAVMVVVLILFLGGPG